MNQLLTILSPELILLAAASVLFFIGCTGSLAARRSAPVLALVAIFLAGSAQVFCVPSQTTVEQYSLSLRADALSGYIRLLALAVAVILLLLAWPTRPDGSGNTALRVGEDIGEFLAMFLLSVAGLLLVASANNLIVLFLALELVSIPTYVMVSISRPLAAAQEAGVKYFFLGAMSVALMLMGFAFVYGTTGQIEFGAIGATLQAGLRNSGPAQQLPAAAMLGVLLILLGLAYKMAAFPLHFYAGDVYEGAATPVTAFLAFVPKAAGFVALVRLLTMVGGTDFVLGARLATLLWWMAALTMTVGNVLALMQNNVKRMLAYSSIAHSGYMLVGIAALPLMKEQALQGVLFYLAAYGIMNSGAFGVLMLLNSREREDDAAEMIEDIAGQGRNHPALGLAMAVSCFSLIGIPLTVGFWGKAFLILPALKSGDSRLLALAIVTVINAAVSAAYYLRIVTVMFLRPVANGQGEVRSAAGRPAAIVASVILSVLGTLVLGTMPQAAGHLLKQANSGAAQPRAAVSASADAGPSL